MALKREKFDKIWKTHRVIQTPDEFFWLVNLVESLNPHTIIEIGVDWGGTLKFWEQLVQPNDLVIGIEKDPKRVKERITWDWENSDRDVVIMVMDSTKPSTVNHVKKLLKGREVDFLFIDGDHSHPSPSLDVINYMPLARNGGIVGFHDIESEGVKFIFDLLSGRKETRGRGTGVWWKP